MRSVAEMVSLTDEQLANLRGPWCSDCGSRDCELDTCDRCGKHGSNLVEVKPLKFRTVCDRCCQERECASCSAKLPRYLLINSDNYEGGGELFCESCSGTSPLELW